MKKLALSALVVTSLFATGGFVGKGSATLVSIKEALNLKDEAPVILEGKIKSQLRAEHYEFVDKNGDTIEIEIDDKKWGDIKVDENTSIQIIGEVDKDFTKTTIDVNSLKILK
ncbi:NirD/YgiW/YdeI family stress tolerance protein [Campylobacter sp. faydin G-24]|uniref:NirD/YgiW/YdeI family stress tolerance protein n=1 Tax=Campylobacter anatolicus TaxID=2829105 RepID=A0ABS5HFJ1_9BACT|nr:NirD/YgiW/YdeI family stress tolerance protein [Campylobacter anatolicus]MBR8463026.1 NirD/YgiW/YdeI family stress tolerance protein [Campylobacter anatolicus]MBR8465652.1 NirD/YgiW/YdeI family stress tolerance protein [Campylobacter anatolicus]